MLQPNIHRAVSINFWLCVIMVHSHMIPIQMIESKLSNIINNKWYQMRRKREKREKKATGKTTAYKDKKETRTRQKWKGDNLHVSNKI